MFCSLYFASIFCLKIITCPIYEKAIFTAYTLSKDETDSDPCVGAGNNNLCEERRKGRFICASRRIPLKTKIIIKGIGECEILDRTSIKYEERIDILFPTKKEALKFGKQELYYRIIN
jgi:3D (Asp-Asp-Asp) domain-containing protein